MWYECKGGNYPPEIIADLDTSNYESAYGLQQLAKPIFYYISYKTPRHDRMLFLYIILNQRYL